MLSRKYYSKRTNSFQKVSLETFRGTMTTQVNLRNCCETAVCVCEVHLLCIQWCGVVYCLSVVLKNADISCSKLGLNSNSQAIIVVIAVAAASKV